MLFWAHRSTLNALQNTQQIFRPFNPPEMENLKLVLNVSTLSIADYLDDLPMCPRIQDDKIYLERLLDITSSTPFI